MSGMPDVLGVDVAAKPLQVGIIGATSNGEFGGVESYMSQMTSRLLSRNIKSKVYVPIYDGGEQALTDQFEKVPYWNLAGLRGPSSYFSAIRKAYRDCDLLHYHQTIASAFDHLSKKPSVLTVHGNPRILPYLSRFKHTMYDWIEPFGLNKVNKIIAVTPSLQLFLKNHFGLDSEYIPHGAAPAIHRPPKLIKKFGLYGQDYMLFLGRLTPEKGLESLIRAYERSSRKQKLVLAGDDAYFKEHGRYMTYLKSIAPSGVIFTGKACGELKQELYANASIFISPHTISGLPLTVVEAMSYGKCVIASDADYIIPEVCNLAYGHTLKFRNGDVEQLAASMDHAIDDKDLCEQIGQEAKSFVAQYHCWEYVVNRYAEIYQELAN